MKTGLATDRSVPELLPTSRRASVGRVIALSAVVQSWGTLLVAFSPSLQADLLSGSTAKLGLLYSLVAWAGMFGTIGGGFLSDRFGPSWVLQASLGIGAAASVVTGLVSNASGFYVSVSCLTFALYAASIGVTSLLPRLSNGSSRRILSVQLAATGLLTMLLPLMVGALQIRSGNSSTASFRTSCFITAAALIAGYAFTRSDLKSSESIASRESVDVTRCGSLGALAVVVLLSAVHISIDSTIWSFVPSFFQSFESHPFPPAWILSGYAGGYLLSRIFLSVLPEGRRETILLIAPGLAAAVLEAVGFRSGSFLTASVCYWSASLFCGLEYPVLLGFAARHLPRRFGTALAAGGAVGGFLCGVLSFVVGKAGEHPGGLDSAMSILPLGFALFSVIALVWILAIRCRPAVSEKEAL